MSNDQGVVHGMPTDPDFADDGSKTERYEFADILLRRQKRGGAYEVVIAGHSYLTKGVKVEMGGELKGQNPCITITFPVAKLRIEDP